MATITLEIEGMTCASCVHRLERVFEHESDVLHASVNLATRMAVVETNREDAAPLIAAVEKAGYGATVHRGPIEVGREGRVYGRRLVVASLLTFYIVMLSLLERGGSTLTHVGLLLVATPVQFYCGWPFLRAAAQAYRRHAYTMDSLVSAGSLAAYGYSLWAVIAGGHEVYFDTSAMIITLILAGRTMESFARARAGDAARLLQRRAATTATVVRSGGAERIPVDQLTIGDVVIVLPGEKVPADGTVSAGGSSIDLSMLTGESAPVDVLPGDEVFAATVNTVGRLEVRVTRVGADTKLAEIVRLLESTQASKAPIQRLADRVSGVFVPAIFGIAAMTMIGWLAFSTAGPGAALLHATAVLLIACPCALGLATPAAVMAGSGRAAELGILFKGGEVFEAARGIDTVLIDKTGTLTEGSMSVREVRAVSGVDADRVLALAAGAEAGSGHPIARAVMDLAAQRRIPALEGSRHETTPGSGVSAVVDGVMVRVGRPEGLPADAATVAEGMSRDGLTPLGVWADERLIGLLSVSDHLKDDAPTTVRWLREFGFDVALVSGDRRPTTEAVGAEVGIDRIVAEVYPEGKVQEVRRLQAAGHRVAFVGDGINDAPALAQADVGVALGTGTDVALEAADVTILGGDLERVADALFLARWTYGVIGQNLTWAFAYNLVMVPLAAFGRLTPLMAAAAMAGSSVTVVLNALRLRHYRSGRTLTATDPGDDPLEALKGIAPEEIRGSEWALGWW